MDMDMKDYKELVKKEERQKLNAGLLAIGIVFYICIWATAGLSFLFFWGAILSKVGGFAYAFFLIIGSALLGAGGWLIMISFGDYVEQITRKLIKLENQK